MEEIAVADWNAFEDEVDNLESIRAKAKKRGKHIYVSKPLFRGQSSSSWKLKTSLERYVGPDIGIQQYNKYLLRIGPAVEAFTGKQWKLSRSVSSKDTSFQSVTNYEFMAYARHHGFPTPLLDWSQSPYVALFFAFQHANEDDEVAVYAYIDDIGKGRGGWVGSPYISEQGEYVAAHTRHFVQQSQYTIATKKHENKWVYCNHHEYFDNTRDNKQALLFKFIFSGSQKLKFLRKLNRMNLNAYTLYGSEESLMDMLAFREIIEKDL